MRTRALIAIIGASIALAGCNVTVDQPPRGPVYRPLPPGPGPGPGPWPGPGAGRPDRPPQGMVCRDGPARRILGDRANQATYRAAQDLSGARVVRVVRHGDAVTQDFRRDRLTITTYRGQVVEVRCG
jgi:Peptidase inhibitor I78 family.